MKENLITFQCFQITVCTNRKFASIIKADNSFNTLTKLYIDVIKR